MEEWEMPRIQREDVDADLCLFLQLPSFLRTLRAVACRFALRELLFNRGDVASH